MLEENICKTHIQQRTCTQTYKELLKLNSKKNSIKKVDKISEQILNQRNYTDRR